MDRKQQKKNDVKGPRRMRNIEFYRLQPAQITNHVKIPRRFGKTKVVGSLILPFDVVVFNH